MKHSWVSIDHDLTLLFILTPQIREVRIHIKWFGKKKLFSIRIYQKSGHFYVGSVNSIIECTFNPLFISYPSDVCWAEIKYRRTIYLLINEFGIKLSCWSFDFRLVFFHCLEIQKSRTSLVTDKEGVLRKSGIIPNVERTFKYL